MLTIPSWNVILLVWKHRLPAEDSCWSSSRARPVESQASQSCLQSRVSPPCQTLCVLCHVAQIRRELEPQTWIFSCCSSVQLISHRTPTDFIFINNYSLAFITVSSRTIILHASILIAQTVCNLWGLIIRKLCKVHFPLQVSKEDSFVFRQIKLLIALCFLQL